MIIKIGDKEFNFDGYANINEIARAFDEAQNKAYEQGRADAIAEISREMRMLYGNEYEKEIRADAIDEYKLGLLEEFDLYEHEHGYPCMADINEILNDTAEQLKEKSNDY